MNQVHDPNLVPDARDERAAREADREDGGAGDDRAPRKRDHERDARDEAHDVQHARPAAVVRRLRVGRGVRDRVVDEHAERREADRAAQVGGEHEQHDDDAERQLRMIRHAVARMHRRKPLREVAVARHRERPCGRHRRSAPAARRDSRPPRPTRTMGVGPGGADRMIERSGEPVPCSRRAQPARRQGAARRRRRRRSRPRCRARSESLAGSSARGRAPPRRASRSARSRRTRRRAGPPTGARRRRRRARTAGPSTVPASSPPAAAIAPTTTTQREERRRDEHASEPGRARDPAVVHGSQHAAPRRRRPPRCAHIEPRDRVRRERQRHRRARRGLADRRSPSPRGSPTTHRGARGRRRRSRPRSGTARRAAPTRRRCSTRRLPRARARSGGRCRRRPPPARRPRRRRRRSSSRAR